MRRHHRASPRLHRAAGHSPPPRYPRPNRQQRFPRLVMKIQTISVTAGRCFNHAHEEYSNLRPEVTMTATLENGEDAAIATRALQQRAEGLVEDHKQALLRSIEELYQLTTKQAEIRG